APGPSTPATWPRPGPRTWTAATSARPRTRRGVVRRSAPTRPAGRWPRPSAPDRYAPSGPRTPPGQGGVFGVTGESSPTPGSVDILPAGTGTPREEHP